VFKRLMRAIKPALLGLIAMGVSSAALAQGPAASYIIEYDAIHHPVVAADGMVVSQNAIASDVGRAILAKGGNAVDAAVATGLALAVTLPRAGNIGGGGFMLVYLAETKQTLAIEYYGAAPRGITPTLLTGADGKLDPAKRYSYRGVAVPGTPAGFYFVQRKYGKLSWRAVVQPAVDLARRGVFVSDDMAYAFRVKAPELVRDPVAARTVYRQGQPYARGERLVQKDLAWSLEQLRDKGADAFYRGEVGRRIVSASAANGGVLTAQDLSDYQIKVQEPLWTTYRGVKIALMPPPSAGVLLGELLNLIETFPMRDLGQNSSDSLHVLAETSKLMFADRARYMGGYPDYVVPTQGLLSKAYAKDRAAAIRMDASLPAVSLKPGDPVGFASRDTTHYSVVDRYGNAVSNTFTLGSDFGAHVMAPGTGFFLNDAVANFAWDAAQAAAEPANAPAPGKRVISTITPVIAFKGDKPWLLSGSPGGTRIMPTVAQVLVNVIDHDLNLAEAIERPRLYQDDKGSLQLEPGFPRDIERLLAARGHRVTQGLTMGSAQSILVGEGLLYGGVDTRRPDAAAFGLEP
jgi:gamma-glutamyltranspeptidase / glutathione hydrolase